MEEAVTIPGPEPSAGLVPFSEKLVNVCGDPLVRSSVPFSMYLLNDQPLVLQADVGCSHLPQGELNDVVS